MSNYDIPLITLVCFCIIALVAVVEFSGNTQTRAVKVESRLETPHGTTWYLSSGDSLDFSYARPGEMTLVQYSEGLLTGRRYDFREHPAMKYSRVLK